MRHFRIAWPTVLAATGCIAFTFALIWTQTATAGDIGQIYQTHSYSRVADDTVFFAHNNDYECGNNQECRDGDYYYQQKYGFIYSPPADRVAQDMAMEVDESDSYIYQYEEAGGTEAEDSEVRERGNEAQEADAEENEDERYGYEYAFPEDLYGSSLMPSTNIVEVEEMMMEQPWGDINRYMDDQYTGSPYIVDIVDYPPGFETGENLVLFTWDPAELLTWSDQEILRVLATAGDLPSGVRRAVLSDYIESLGMEATDLSIRFEEISGLVVPELSDDMAQTAAFMACFRLVERGELESDEALALLQKSFLHRSNRWNCWIDEITRVRAASNPMLKAVVLTAAATLERLGGAISGISHQIKNLY